MRSRRLLGMAVLIPVALVGCGSSSDGKPGGAKGAYIEQSDVICADVITKSNSIGNAKDQATAQQQADLWNDAFKQLDALQEPQESVELARQFVTDTDNLHMSYLAAAAALQFNDQTKANKAFSDVDTIRQRAAKTADEYGYTDCVGINGESVEDDN